MRKNQLQETSSDTFSAQIFSCLFFCLVQFEINLHLCVFQKTEIAWAKASFSSLKNSLLQINSKLKSKPYDNLYKQLKFSITRLKTQNGKEKAS